MEILTTDEVAEWLRQDIDTDANTFRLLVMAGKQHVEHLIDYTLEDSDVPESLKHAILVFVAAHYDDRSGSNEAAMRTVASLCRPYWRPRL